MRLLVTGGAGFMGSNYIHHTATTNPEARILVYDKHTHAGRPENLQGLDPSRVKPPQPTPSTTTSSWRS